MSSVLLLERYVRNCFKLRFNRLYVAMSSNYRLRDIDMRFSEACKAFLTAEEKHELGSVPEDGDDGDLA